MVLASIGIWLRVFLSIGIDPSELESVGILPWSSQVDKSRPDDAWVIGIFLVILGLEGS